MIVQLEILLIIKIITTQMEIIVMVFITKHPPTSIEAIPMVVIVRVEEEVTMGDNNINDGRHFLHNNNHGRFHHGILYANVG